ncbi:MAG: hypothetical protein LBT47_10560 [Deltaproteobacteria bacterium]|jgi:hypothetical protein|nr:hypothetical protein [Deltaproteobacteria bacterium]
MNRRATETGGQAPALLVLAFLVLILVPVFWPPISIVYRRGARIAALILIKPVPDSESKAAVVHFLETQPIPSPEETKIIGRFLGLAYRYPALLFSGFWLLLVRTADPGLRFRTRHTMESLLNVSAVHFKCLQPIVKTGPITDYDNFEGPWALAENPLRFVLARGLLKDDANQAMDLWKVLDQETAMPLENISDYYLPPFRLDYGALVQVLARQLGAVFRGNIRALEPPLIGLAAAFLAHWMDRKTMAMKIFDQLSESWEPQWLAERSEPKGSLSIAKVSGRPLARSSPEVELTEAKAFLNELGQRPGGLLGVAESVGHFRYVNVWFMALLTLARTKGVLPSSLWIWLKPTDRVLFYALNQVGGRTAWAEAVGVWSHWEAEKAAGEVLNVPMVEKAADALTKSLIEDGWLNQPSDPAARSQAPSGGEHSIASPRVGYANAPENQEEPDYLDDQGADGYDHDPLSPAQAASEQKSLRPSFEPPSDFPDYCQIEETELDLADFIPPSLGPSWEPPSDLPDDCQVKDSELDLADFIPPLPQELEPLEQELEPQEQGQGPNQEQKRNLKPRKKDLLTAKSPNKSRTLGPRKPRRS